MNKKVFYLFTCILILATATIFAFGKKDKTSDDRFVTYIVDTRKQDIKFYWKDERQDNFRSIQNLKTWLGIHHKTLVFAMNGGMYQQDNSPQGLFIENGKIVMPLDTSSGSGNFYLKPNGVFYITIDNLPVISTTANFSESRKIKYATQSGTNVSC